MADSEDDGWEFTLDDLEEETADDPAAVDDGNGAPERGDEHDGGNVDTESDVEDGGNVAGSLTVEDSVEPGQPTAENTFFVVLGFTATLLLFLSIAGLI